MKTFRLSWEKYLAGAVLTILLGFAMIFGLAGHAQAAETKSITEETGSIELTMKYENTLLTDGKVRIYKVASVKSGDSGYYFDFVSGLKDKGLDEISDASSKKLGSASYANQIKKAVDDSAGSTADISNGKAAFSNLSAGVYLIWQSEKDKSKGYKAISPFLVTIPNDGKYKVDATPKMDIVKEPTSSSSSGPTNPTKKTTTSTMPQSGQLWWPVWVLSFGGAILLFMGCLVKRSNKAKQRAR